MTWVPFALHGLRVALLGLMLCVPRRHPRRAVLLLCVFLAEVVLDLLDGVVARRLGMVDSRALWWSDHMADLAFFLGTALIVLKGLSFFPGAAEAPPESPRARVAATLLWVSVLLGLGLATLVLMAGRALLVW